MFLAFVPYGTPPSNAPDLLRGYFFTCIETAPPPAGRPVQGSFSWPAAEAVRPRLLMRELGKRLRPLRRLACGPNCRQNPLSDTPRSAHPSPGLLSWPAAEAVRLRLLAVAREDFVQGQAASAAALLQGPVVAVPDSVPDIGSGFNWALPKEPGRT